MGKALVSIFIIYHRGREDSQKGIVGLRTLWREGIGVRRVLCERPCGDRGNLYREPYNKS